MSYRTLTLDELKQQPLESVLAEIVQHHLALTVRLPDGKEVMIAPKPHLEPLSELEGFVPEGWKDAIYDHKRLR
jgi:hypothetical protein